MKGHYAKGCKDLIQPKLTKKDEKKGSKKDLTAAAAAASTPVCESRPVTIVNDEDARSARANECTA